LADGKQPEYVNTLKVISMLLEHENVSQPPYFAKRKTISIFLQMEVEIKVLKWKQALIYYFVGTSGIDSPSLS
jgi:hypothetical protein